MKFTSIAALIGISILGHLSLRAQVALTPSSPAISPSPLFVPGGPASTPNAANPGVIATNSSLVALADALIVLQTNLQQTLPELARFNDNFDFRSLGDNGQAGSANTAPPGNFSSNLGTNFAANFGVNAAVPTGQSPNNTIANRTTVTAAGLPQGFANIPVTRDTLRALLVLQSDMQRMLPILNALNTGTTEVPGSFTNLFGVVRANP
jgi:hypothetical protein